MSRQSELQGIIARCEEHAQEGVWVICVHTDLIAGARVVEDNVVTGEALCPACKALVEAKRPTEAALRIACGGCVRERWPIGGAS